VERVTFKAITGREHETEQRVDQFVAVVGRRGGKSRSMATLATYIAVLCDHSDALVPGERGVLLCVALDQRVAHSTIFLTYFHRPCTYRRVTAAVNLDGADAVEQMGGDVVRHDLADRGSGRLVSAQRTEKPTVQA